MEQDQKVISNDVNSEASSAEASDQDKVAYATHKQLLAQHKRTKSENDELRAKLEAYEAQQREIEENKLRQQGELKKLLDLKEKEISEYKGKYTKLEQTVINDYKTRAFEKALPGKIRNEKYLNFVDLNTIVINPESGEIDQDSLKVTVDQFMKEHGESLVARQATGKLPTASTPVTGISLEKPVANMTRTEQMESLKGSISALIPAILAKK